MSAADQSDAAKVIVEQIYTPKPGAGFCDDGVNSYADFLRFPA
jgi:hypothetical protein